MVSISYTVLFIYLFIQTEEDDYSEVMNDAAFVQSVLENLPGVDPQSEAIRNAMTSLTKPDDHKKDTDKKDGKK